MIDETIDGSASSSVIVAFSAFAAWSVSSHAEKSRTGNAGPLVVEETAPSGADAKFMLSAFPRPRVFKIESSISISSKDNGVGSTVIGSSRELSKEKSVPGCFKGCCVWFDTSEGSRYTPLDLTVGETWDTGSWGDEDTKVESKFPCFKFSSGSNTGSKATTPSVNVEKGAFVPENPEDCCGTSDRRVEMRPESLGPESKTPELVPSRTFVEDEDAGVSSELGTLCSWKELGDLAAVMPPSKPFILQTQHGAKSVGISVILRRMSVCLKTIVCQGIILRADVHQRTDS